MVLRCYSRRNLLPAFSKQRLVVGHHHDLPSAPLLSRLAAVQVRRHMTQHSAPLSPSATHSSPSPPSSQPQPHPQSARLSSAPSTPSQSRQPAQSTRSPSRPRSRPAANHHEPWSFFSPRAAAWRSPTSPGAPKHPLVRKLLTELYSTHRPVAANRVWRAYNAVREASIPRVGSSTETASLMDQLEPVHHQLVLRAIDPHVARARRLHRLTAKRRRLEATSDQDASPAPSTSTSTSATPALAPDASMPSSFPDHAPSAAAHDASVAFFDSFNRKMLAQAAAKISSKSVFDATYSVREYMHRVNVIFREMRRLSRAASSPEQQQLPTLSDYNHVLSRLALGGHIGVMANLWNELTGVSAKRNASAAAVEQPLVPNRATYRELMVGLTKHASDQTERVQKAEASAAVKTKRSLEKSARAAAGGLAKYGQILAPSARGAAILAALRTMALLKDMRDHDVQPNQLTRDLAARTLRLAGHLDGLNMLMKQAYGIDLTAPGSTAAAGSDRDFPRPTVHTLNTVLMTLGEQATVPEMIAAYETIVRPTPAPGGRWRRDGGFFRSRGRRRWTEGAVCHKLEGSDPQRAGARFRGAGQRRSPGRRWPRRRFHGHGHRQLCRRSARGCGVSREAAPLRPRAERQDV
ncbi:uncharacterized protein PFL1_03249 [Pseudozyma flocculosa PF-1]|uniref:Uncharacterized protein n=1 Tax=Pseudozyma flocculosa PF-1 TaxID=1277687 RepID=A0A061H919_9BASI|nr:uncharacterized protein PFL1_03249 [Pseudozyma flocculosa PF-1]EPQ28959.1 hypothetical protein PFL1_03249 [Pseudozyma flocculosa PF-1]